MGASEGPAAAVSRGFEIFLAGLLCVSCATPYQRGLASREAGRFDEAVRELTAAYQQACDPGVLLQIAETFVDEGD
jgi:hypothetical protein